MNKLINFLTYDQIRKLIKEAKEKETKLAIILGAGSGLRISEIVGGKRKDGTMIPPLSKDMINLKDHQIRIIQGKGKKDRITVTSPWLKESHLSLLPIKLPQRTLQHRFNVLTEKVFGERYNFHMLRHSFGNYMVVEKRVPMTVVQQLMGHSRLDTTSIYSKANPKQAIESAWGAFE